MLAFRLEELIGQVKKMEKNSANFFPTSTSPTDSRARSHSFDKASPKHKLMTLKTYSTDVHANKSTRTLFSLRAIRHSPRNRSKASIWSKTQHSGRTSRGGGAVYSIKDLVTSLKTTSLQYENDQVSKIPEDKVVKMQAYVRGWIIRHRFSMIIRGPFAASLRKRNTLLIKFQTEEKEYTKSLMNTLQELQKIEKFFASSKPLFRSKVRKEAQKYIKQVTFCFQNIYTAHNDFCIQLAQLLEFLPEPIDISELMADFASQWHLYMEYVQDFSHKDPNSLINSVQDLILPPKFDQKLRMPLEKMNHYRCTLNELLTLTVHDQEEWFATFDVYEHAWQLDDYLKQANRIIQMKKRTVSLEAQLSCNERRDRQTSTTVWDDGSSGTKRRTSSWSKKAAKELRANELIEESTISWRDNLLPVLKCGWVWKKSDTFKQWRKRYFVIRGQKLEYYHKFGDKARDPTGVFILSNCDISTAETLQETLQKNLNKEIESDSVEQKDLLPTLKKMAIHDKEERKRDTEGRGKKKRSGVRKVSSTRKGSPSTRKQRFNSNGTWQRDTQFSPILTSKRLTDQKSDFDSADSSERLIKFRVKFQKESVRDLELAVDSMQEATDWIKHIRSASKFLKIQLFKQLSLPHRRVEAEGRFKLKKNSKWVSRETYFYGILFNDLFLIAKPADDMNADNSSALDFVSLIHLRNIQDVKSINKKMKNKKTFNMCTISTNTDSWILYPQPLSSIPPLEQLTIPITEDGSHYATLTPRRSPGTPKNTSGKSPVKLIKSSSFNGPFGGLLSRSPGTSPVGSPVHRSSSFGKGPDLVETFNTLIEPKIPQPASLWTASIRLTVDHFSALSHVDPEASIKEAEELLAEKVEEQNQRRAEVEDLYEKLYHMDQILFKTKQKIQHLEKNNNSSEKENKLLQKSQAKRTTICQKIPQTSQHLSNANCAVVNLAYLKDDLNSFRSMVAVQSNLPLTLYGLRTAKFPQVPESIRDLADYIFTKGGKVEGIFRVPGVNDEIAILKTRLNEGEDISTESYGVFNIHSIAGAFKLFWREFPEPLLTSSRYQPFMDAFGSQDEKKVISLFEDLPEINKKFLIFLLKFLVKMSEFQEISKMSIDNLALVFAPNLLRPEIETHQTLIEDSKKVIWVVTVLMNHSSNWEDIEEN